MSQAHLPGEPAFCGIERTKENQALRRRRGPRDGAVAPGQQRAGPVFGLPYIKGVNIGEGPVDNAIALQMQFPGAAAFLFDGPTPGEGMAFDWSRIPTGLSKPFMIAGGLRPGTVFEAIQLTLPWGVDVSSGIETEPGVKDGERMRRFVEEVRRADCHVEPDEEADQEPGMQSSR